MAISQVCLGRCQITLVRRVQYIRMVDVRHHGTQGALTSGVHIATKIQSKEIITQDLVQP